MCFGYEYIPKHKTQKQILFLLFTCVCVSTNTHTQMGMGPGKMREIIFELFENNPQIFWEKIEKFEKTKKIE